jgi:hypothetical protein
MDKFDIIQSTDAAAGLVDNPIAGLVDKGMASKSIEIVIFAENEDHQRAALDRVREAVMLIGAEKVINIKSRDIRLFRIYAIWEGFLGSPVLKINGKVYTEKALPDAKVLANHIKTLII